MSETATDKTAGRDLHHVGARALLTPRAVLERDRGGRLVDDRHSVAGVASWALARTDHEGRSQGQAQSDAKTRCSHALIIEARAEPVARLRLATGGRCRPPLVAPRDWSWLG